MTWDQRNAGGGGGAPSGPAGGSLTGSYPNPTIGVTQIKSGTILAAAFAGNPKKATVTFGTTFSSNGYSISFSPSTDGSRTFSLEVESKLATGFVVDLNTNSVTGLIEVGWHAILYGS